MNIRSLKTGDEKLLEDFLSGHAETSMFLRSNVRKAGLLYKDKDFHGDYFGAFDDGGALQGVLAHYWNGNVMMQAPDKDILKALTGYFANGVTRPVGGVIGPTEQCETVICDLEIKNLPYAIDSSEDLYRLELDHMTMPEAHNPEQFEMVPARDLGQDILAAWLRAYNIEALGADEDEKLDTGTDHDVKMTMENNNRWGLLAGGKPVALSGFNAELPDIVQIGPVWTPPEHRGNGYARMIVALSLKQAYENGVKKAVLFTDNPPAAKAYEALGFEKGGKYRLALLKDNITLDHRVAL